MAPRSRWKEGALKLDGLPWKPTQGKLAAASSQASRKRGLARSLSMLGSQPIKRMRLRKKSPAIRLGLLNSGPAGSKAAHELAEPDEVQGAESDDVLTRLAERRQQRQLPSIIRAIGQRKDAAVLLKSQQELISGTLKKGKRKKLASLAHQPNLNLKTISAEDELELFAVSLPTSADAGKKACKEFERQVKKGGMKTITRAVRHHLSKKDPFFSSISALERQPKKEQVAAEVKANVSRFEQRQKDDLKRQMLWHAIQKKQKSDKSNPNPMETGALDEGHDQNDFEAALGVKAESFGDKVEAVLCKGASGPRKSAKVLSLADAAWTEVSEKEMQQALHKTDAGLQDYVRCWEAACKLNRMMTGTYVPHYFEQGFFLNRPFHFRTGQNLCHCSKCGQWVKKSYEMSHALRCNKSRSATLTKFRQFAGQDLGLRLHYSHSPDQRKVALSLKIPLTRVIRLADWSCYWKPDDLECSWRVRKTEMSEPLNQLPPPKALPRGHLEQRGLHLSSRAPKRHEDLEDEDFSNDDEAMNPFGGAVNRMNSDDEDDEDDISDEDLDEPAAAGQAQRPPENEEASAKFKLKNSFGTVKAHQPLVFSLALKPEQLHTLGWMLQREGRTPTGSVSKGEAAEPYVSTHTLERRVAETDISFQLRMRRTYRHALGGICADSMGYGKTACFIGLVASDLQASITDNMLAKERELASSRILTNATLIITPPNLFEQWRREFEKFVRPEVGIKVLPVPNHSKMKQLKVKDFMEADVVIVSFRLFFSEPYMRYFDEITNPEVKGKLWDEESRKRVQEARQKKKDPVAAAALEEAQPKKKVYAPFNMGAEEAFRRGFTQKEKRPGFRFWRYYCFKTPGAANPTVKLSKQYKDMQSNEAYGSGRYAHMSEYVKEMLARHSAEEVGKSPALFEMFYWKRVCFDEFHEVVRAKSQEGAAGGARRATLYALHSLAGRCSWGLTGTPLLSSSQAVSDMASLLRVFIAPDEDAEAERWLDTWVRSNTWDKSSIPLEERWVTVRLSAPERALYLSQKNILQGARNAEGQMAQHAEERLLMLCTHFDPDNWQSEDAGNAVLTTQEKQKVALQRAEEGVRDCDEKLADLHMRIQASTIFQNLRKNLGAGFPLTGRPKQLVIAHTDAARLSELKDRADVVLKEVTGSTEAEASLEKRKELFKELSELSDCITSNSKRLSSGKEVEESLKAATLKASTPCFGDGCALCAVIKDPDEAIKHYHRSRGIHEGKRKEMESQIRFLESTVDGLNGKSFECSFCLDSTHASGKDAAILTCGHAFHQECLYQALSQQQSCPICRQPATAAQATNLADLFAAAEAKSGESELASADAELSRSCGSKVAAIVNTIRQLQGPDGVNAGAEKCVIFIQWDGVMRHLERGMRSVGLSPIVLQGSVIQRTLLLKKFMDEKAPESSILLLSLEQSPSGMNLVCSRNVFLVHPMHARTKQEAINFERQAIGRVLRQGQERAVRIFRFVTQDTVEEEISRRHHAEIFSAATDEERQRKIQEAGEDKASGSADVGSAARAAASSSS